MSGSINDGLDGMPEPKIYISPHLMIVSMKKVTFRIDGFDIDVELDESAAMAICRSLRDCYCSNCSKDCFKCKIAILLRYFEGR